MTKRPKNYEPPLHLDMDPDEALERFIATEPKQVETSIKRAKKKLAAAPKKKKVASKKKATRTKKR